MKYKNDQQQQQQQQNKFDSRTGPINETCVTQFG